VALRNLANIPLSPSSAICIDQSNSWRSVFALVTSSTRAVTSETSGSVERKATAGVCEGFLGCSPMIYRSRSRHMRIRHSALLLLFACMANTVAANAIRYRRQLSSESLCLSTDGQYCIPGASSCSAGVRHSLCALEDKRGVVSFGSSGDKWGVVFSDGGPGYRGGDKWEVESPEEYGVTGHGKSGGVNAQLPKDIAGLVAVRECSAGYVHSVSGMGVGCSCFSSVFFVCLCVHLCLFSIWGCTCS
jgi:hypothetical protein